MTFFKNHHGPHGMPTQVVWAGFELVVARFGPPRIPKCLENGLFRYKKSVKNKSKCVFPTMIRDHFGCLNKWNEPILGPLQARMASPKSLSALKLGCFGTKN